MSDRRDGYWERLQACDPIDIHEAQQMLNHLPMGILRERVQAVADAMIHDQEPEP